MRRFLRPLGLAVLGLAASVPLALAQPAEKGNSLPATNATSSAAMQPIQSAIQPQGMIVEERSFWTGTGRGLFRSDTAFSDFIGPVTNPVFAKDPRSLTYARALYIQNTIPSNHPLGGGDLQALALQINVALTERLTFIADKDGYAFLHPRGGASTDGWLNLGVGLKYQVIRDEENQFLWSVGGMWEPQTGESDVFQGHGDGTFTVFTTIGKEFGCKNHALLNLGYQFPFNNQQNSSYIFTQLHLDRQIAGWFYPLVELNWYHWVASGNRGLPPELGEGDGLLNLGTSGVAGNDLVTFAFGAKMRLRQNLDLGAAWEIPLTSRRDLILNRLTIDMVFKY